MRFEDKYKINQSINRSIPINQSINHTINLFTLLFAGINTVLVNEYGYLSIYLIIRRDKYSSSK